MITIKTYINPSNKPIHSLKEAANYPTQFFIDMEDGGRMTNIMEHLDLHYLNGAIVMKDNNKIIMNFTHWDLVDQLWAYLINTVEDVLKVGHGSTFFPDQPIKFELKTIANNFMLVIIDDGEQTRQLVDKQEFLSTLLKSAEHFYSLLNFYFNEKVNYDSEFNQINSLRKKLLN